MDAQKGILTFLLALLTVPASRSSDFYLPRVGPAPLRFASPVPDARAFSWPIPLNRGAMPTNCQAPSSVSEAVATNSAPFFVATTQAATNDSQSATPVSGATSNTQIPFD